MKEELCDARTGARRGRDYDTTVLIGDPWRRTKTNQDSLCLALSR